jgi:tubulin polyglutamylase TTLL6/13
MAEQAVPSKRKKRAPKVIYFNIDSTQYPAISRCGKRLGWRTTKSTEKNVLFWADLNVGVDFCLSMRPWQFVNHFPGTFAISRKVELWRTYERVRRLFPELYTFHPLSFILPTQLSDLQRHMQTSTLQKRTFIVKPDLGAQGRGIFLVMDPDSLIGHDDSAIAQQYIAPFLLGGLKFDLRIYALVTSIAPLRIYVYDEGMSRFCTAAYRKPRPHNLKDVFCHLTNYSVNKKNENFRQPTEEAAGHKRSLTSVLSELSGLGGDVARLRRKIDDLVVLTVLAAQPFIAHNYRASVRADDGKSRCFEILGFDVLIDKRMNPWLLEVNSSPSLLCESPFDKDLKENLITGAMNIIDLDAAFKKKTIAYERGRTVRRISGTADAGDGKRLWNPERETKIAQTTRWRLIHPGDDRQDVYDQVLAEVQKLPIDGVAETAASQRRREAVQQAIHDKEATQQPPAKKPNKVRAVDHPPAPPIQIGRTPRSQLLLREAKLSRLRSEAKREQAARIQATEQPQGPPPRGRGRPSACERLPPFATQQLVLELDL